jgi:hypothetical protein
MKILTSRLFVYYQEQERLKTQAITAVKKESTSATRSART